MMNNQLGTQPEKEYLIKEILTTRCRWECGLLLSDIGHDDCHIQILTLKYQLTVIPQSQVDVCVCVCVWTSMSPGSQVTHLVKRFHKTWLLPLYLEHINRVPSMMSEEQVSLGKLSNVSFSHGGRPTTPPGD